ncbi:MAG TPA: MFS transporter [Anaerolineaceae bacterium]|nr:MFS transporter [Anaerolineaceae bacterium]HPN51544.1 MFS transporter [Anaerolineaceae bacterium]
MKPLPPLKVYLIMTGVTAFLYSLIFTASSVYQVTMALLTPLELVLVGTVLETSVFLFEVPTGVVADVFSRRLSILIGMFLIGLAFMVEGSFPFFMPILIAQVIWGLGHTFTSGATAAWITDEIGEEAAGQAFLNGAQIEQAAGVAGVIGGILLGNLGVNWPVVSGGAGFLLLGLFLIAAMQEHGFKPAPREERRTWAALFATFRDGLKSVRQRPALGNILWIGFFFGLYSEALDRLWTAHLIEDVGLPAWPELSPVVWTGALRLVGMLLSIWVAGWAQRRTDTGSTAATARSVKGFTVVLVAAVAVFGLSPWFWLCVLSYWVIFAARVAIAPLYTAWVNQRLDSGVRATVLSMSSQVDALGQIAGGPALGLVAAQWGMTAALVASSVILSPILALFNRAKE